MCHTQLHNSTSKYAFNIKNFPQHAQLNLNFHCFIIWHSSYFRTKPSLLELCLLFAQPALAHHFAPFFFLSSVPTGLDCTLLFCELFPLHYSRCACTIAIQGKPTAFLLLHFFQQLLSKSTGFILFCYMLLDNLFLAP